MNTSCQKIHAGRAHARSNGLTPQIVDQAIEALTSVHVGQRSFAPAPRCDCLKGVRLPAQPRLAQKQNSAALRGKIKEVRTSTSPPWHSAAAGFSYV